MTADPTRRSVVAASTTGLAFLITACKGVQVLGNPPPPPSEVRTLRAAIAAEEHLVTIYTAAASPAGARGHRDATLLAALLTEHRQHLTQLRSRLIETAAQRSAAAASSTPSPAGPSGPAGSGLLDLGQLAQAELTASDRLIGQLAGLPPSLAQLFASIAAAEATHVPLLRSLGRRS